jgi:hypothetical protein
VNRINQILAAVLVVQALLAVALFLRDDQTSIRSLEPLLASFDPTKVERIQVFEGGKGDEDVGEKKEKKKSNAVDLVKRGDDWVLASHFDYPVEAQKVTDLLDKVKGMRSRGPVASGKARIKQLEVGDDDFQRKLVLTAGGKETVLYIGASAGARQTSVRLAGKDDVHGVSGLTSFGVGATASAWVDTAYFTVEAKDVATVDIANGSGSYQLERSDDPSGWKVMINGQPLVIPPDSELHVDKLEGIVGKLARIHLSEPGDPQRTVDKPLATITLRMKAPEAPATQDGGPVTPATSAEPQEYIIDIADAGEAKDRSYVHVRGLETAALVSALSMTDVVELDRGLLIAKKGEGKKEPPEGAGDGMQGMQGMENLPPDVQQQIMQQMQQQQQQQQGQ